MSSSRSPKITTVKKCKEGKEISSKTGRCVKRCVEQIGEKRNPQTGKCEKAAKASRGCADMKILNPKTGRCILDTPRNRKKVGVSALIANDDEGVNKQQPETVLIVDDDDEEAVVAKITTSAPPLAAGSTLPPNYDVFKQYFTDPKTGTPIKISGPIQFTWFPLVDGKSFYLFGDLHTEGDGCKNKRGKGRKIPFSTRKNTSESEEGIFRVADLFERIFGDRTASGKTQKDFYFEISYIFSKSKNSSKKRRDPEHWGYLPNSSIFSVERKFLDCFNVQKTTPCNLTYPSTRFHYTDVRFERDLSIGKTPNDLEFFVAMDEFGNELNKFVKKSFSSTAVKSNFSLPLIGNAAGLHNLYYLMKLHKIIKEMSSRYFDEEFPFEKMITDMDSISPIESKSSLLEIKIPGFRQKIVQSVKKSHLAKEIINFHKLIADDLYDELFGSGDQIMKEFVESEDFASFYASLETFILSILSGGEKIPKNFDFKLKNYATTAYFKLLIEKFISQNQKIFFFTAARIMDVYTLSRIFRPSTSDSKEVFVYAGNLHIETLINFLKNVVISEEPSLRRRRVLVGNTSNQFYTFASKDEKNKCLDVSKITPETFSVA